MILEIARQSVSSLEFAIGELRQTFFSNLHFIAEAEVKSLNKT